MSIIGTSHNSVAKHWSRLASATVTVIGCLVLMGWMFDIPFLKSVLPGLATMKANTALAFILTGLGLWIGNDDQASQRQRRLVQLCALIVLGIGLLTFSEYVLRRDFGLDQLLFKDTASVMDAAFPGRISQALAFSFILLGTALWLLHYPRWQVFTQFIALVTVFIALLALAGYLYGVESLYDVFAFTSVALHSALTLLIASVGMLLVHAESGPMAVLTTDRPGGILARRLLPAVILFPLLFGWVRLKGQEAGLYGTAFGLALFALSNIVTFTALVWWNARSLNRAALERDQANIALKRYAQRMEILHEIDLGILRGGSMLAVVETTLKHIWQLVPCQRARLAVIDETTNEALVFELDFDGDTTFGPGIRIPLPPEFRAGFDARNMQRIDDIRPLQDANPRLKELVNEGIVSLTGVLLIAEDRLIGSLALLANTPGFFTAEYQEIVAEITNQLAIAIRQLRLTEEIHQRAIELEQNNATLKATEASLKRYAQRMEILHEIDLGIIGATSIPALVQAALQHIRTLFACQQTGVVLFDFTTNEVVFFVLDLNASSSLNPGLRYPLPQGLIEEFSTNTVTVIDDIQLLADPSPTYQQLLKEGMRSSLRALLKFQEHPVGLLALTADTPGYFTAEHREIAAEIASQLSIAIRHMFLTEELSRYTSQLEQTITERTGQLRQSEEKFSKAFQASPAAISIASLPDSRWLEVNESFVKMTGYSREESIGHNSGEFGLVDTTARAKILEAIRTQGSVRDVEIEMHTKSGEIVEVLLSVEQIELNGQACTLNIHYDITKLKQAEKALQQAFEKEKELGDLKSRFVSMASHEFRTPLATILASTETLSAYRQKMTEAQIDSRLGKIREQVDHLKDIMEDVLQLARLQARRVEFNPVKLDLDLLCRSVLDEFQSRSDVTHRFMYSCDDSLHSVYMDKKLMRQIINNLVSNAIKYSPDGEIVTVSLARSDNTLVLQVTDHGIGIPEADLVHLFEPFHRASNIGAISGTGLGLTIIKESIELHSGTISVDSKVGVGTTFTIKISLAVEGVQDHDKNPGD